MCLCLCLSVFACLLARCHNSFINIILILIYSAHILICSIIIIIYQMIYLLLMRNVVSSFFFFFFFCPHDTDMNLQMRLAQMKEPIIHMIFAVIYAALQLTGNGYERSSIYANVIFRIKCKIKFHKNKPYKSVFTNRYERYQFANFHR